MISQGTIVAIATPSGAGALGITAFVDQKPDKYWPFILRPSREKLRLSPKETAFGTLQQEDGRLLDEVLLCCFNAPNSLPRNVVELSYGFYILQEVFQLCLRNGGTRTGRRIYPCL